MKAREEFEFEFDILLMDMHYHIFTIVNELYNM